ncbi:TetR/AcrR family transcriptional regulator [soil metagenome]
MKVTREQAVENRERVLQAASALFRERGFGGIGVADLMKSAGMTHGAFYGQFASKDDLMAQACARAMEASVQRWGAMADKGAAEGSGHDGLARVVKSYLSEAHRDSPGKGCVLPALGSDVAREGPAVRAVVTEGTVSMIDMLTRLMPGPADADKRTQAIGTFASMVGAVVLSRVVDDAALSKEVLDTVVADLL